MIQNRNTVGQHIAVSNWAYYGNIILCIDYCKSSEAAKNYTRMQEPTMPPSLRLYMYQTRQERITFACRNPLCLLPYACTCIKRGSKDLHSHAGTPYASFLTLVHVSNEAGRLKPAYRNPLCLHPVSNEAVTYTRVQDPPIPPSYRFYMYQTRQQDLHSRTGTL